MRVEEGQKMGLISIPSQRTVLPRTKVYMNLQAVESVTQQGAQFFLERCGVKVRIAQQRVLAVKHGRCKEGCKEWAFAMNDVFAQAS